MLFTITGKVSVLSPLREGQSRNGNSWKSQEFVVSVTEGEYVDSYSFEAFGDKVDNLPEVGDEVEVKFTIRSREYNGRWYTQLSLFSWELKARADAPLPQGFSFDPKALEADPTDLPFD